MFQDFDYNKLQMKIPLSCKVKTFIGVIGIYVLVILFYHLKKKEGINENKIIKEVIKILLIYIMCFLLYTTTTIIDVLRESFI